MTSFASPLWRHLQVYQIYGANTNVGKTVASTLLCRAASAFGVSSSDGASTSASRPARHGGSGGGAAAFLKPVSTGPLSEADDRHIKFFAPETTTRCLYQFKEPVSPHIAAADAEHVPADEEIACSVHNVLSSWANEGFSHAFVETAGGVHSPGPSGTSQADIYRPLRLPVVLVADAHLGGISSSVSAYESLLIRGYDVQSVLMFKDEYYKNDGYLEEFFHGKEIPLLAFDKPPARGEDASAQKVETDRQAMTKFYDQMLHGNTGFAGLVSSMSEKHEQRIEKLESMATRAHKSIWYPFTQHKDLKPDALTVIDSARGDQFQVYQHQAQSSSGQSSVSIVGPVFDGSASWWTQGLGHGNPDLALGAAYAAGRYGHVMFALGAHEPAIKLADLLIKNSGNDRFSRVFYSDNGSTGMEVAVKMALRASCDRYGWDASQEEIGIIGLKGSYHGDTIGTMDCSEPSTFNKQVEWYRGRGFWFDFPQVKMIEGTWTVELPEEMREKYGQTHPFASLSEIFDFEKREGSGLEELYRTFIRDTLTDQCKNQGRKFGALILEPIVLGAGGMLLADPLFQQTLVDVVRSEPQLISPNAKAAQTSPLSWSGVPVVFDEVFTGLYRLFHFSPSMFFPPSCAPDIAVNAKLLTGGLLPLAVTLASEEIFAVFNSSPAKEQALLHGHSYTAHPVGCHVGCMSVETMMKMAVEGKWDQFKQDWLDVEELAPSPSTVANSGNMTPSAVAKPQLWSIWSHTLLEDLSQSEAVESVWALGTVLSIVLKDSSGGGYSSSVAQDLQKKLRNGPSTNSEEILSPGVDCVVSSVHFDVQSRVLGNVFYLMTSLTSTKDEVDKMSNRLRKSLLP